MDTPQKYYQTPSHVIAAGVALSVVDIAAVALRFWTRVRRSQALKSDDWLMVPATILTVGIGISMVYATTKESLGYRTKTPADFQGDVQEAVTDQLTLTNKIQWAFALLLPLALGCVKASFLFFYLRIFSVNRKGVVHVLLVGLIVFVAAWSVAFFFATLFECRLSFWAIWGSTLDLITQCIQSMHLVLALCITDFIADVAIICIPIPLVWRLNLSTSRKVAISVVFLFGAVTVAASLTRLIIMARAVAIGFDSDAILVITEYLYWGLVECAIGILAACLPTLHSLLVREFSFESLPNLKTLFKTHPAREPYAEIGGATAVGSKDKNSVSTGGPVTRMPSAWSEAPTVGTEAFVLTEIRAGKNV